MNIRLSPVPTPYLLNRRYKVQIADKASRTSKRFYAHVQRKKQLCNQVLTLMDKRGCLQNISKMIKAWNRPISELTSHQCSRHPSPTPM